MKMDLSGMRNTYERGELRRSDLNPNPMDMFRRWFDETCKCGLIEPNAVSLATSDNEGRPLLRTVLIKQFDKDGFVFFTNLASRKAKHIESNPHVSLMFPWIQLERQVIVCGRAERIGLVESAKYFALRPLESQLGAWASKQSAVVESRKALEIKWEEMKEKFAGGSVPIPSFWGGYRVIPSSIEFWQGRTGRLHDRFLYTLSGKDPQEWRIDRLAP